MSGDFSSQDHDLAIGHVEGLRWWKLEDEWKDAGLSLRGHYDTWQPGTSHAVCKAGYSYEVAHAAPAPSRGCYCGFWAYWRLGSEHMVGAPHVAGIVKGHGKVIKGPDPDYGGFRCATAEIIALAPISYSASVAGALEDRYGVPVYSSIAAMLEMHKAPPTQPALADRSNGGEAARWQSSYAGGAVSVTFSSGSVNLHTTGGMSSYRTMGGGGGYSYCSGGVGGSGTGGQGGATWTPVYQYVCPGCGQVRPTAGLDLCDSCELAQLALKTAPAPVPVTSFQFQSLSQAIRNATTGLDALNQLHARREQWAKDAVTPPEEDS